MASPVEIKPILVLPRSCEAREAILGYWKRRKEDRKREKEDVKREKLYMQELVAGQGWGLGIRALIMQHHALKHMLVKPRQHIYVIFVFQLVIGLNLPTLLKAFNSAARYFNFLT